LSHASRMRQLTECVLAAETEAGPAIKKRNPPVFSAVEKLRTPLTMLMGKRGYRALLGRALALASREVSWLAGVWVKADGSLEIVADSKARRDLEQIAKGRVALLSQLMALLVTFIGERLTLRLLHEVWPRISCDEVYLSNETNHEKTN